jgi:hypothetical protein
MFYPEFALCFLESERGEGKFKTSLEMLNQPLIIITHTPRYFSPLAKVTQAARRLPPTTQHYSRKDQAFVCLKLSTQDETK